MVFFFFFFCFFFFVWIVRSQSDFKGVCCHLLFEIGDAALLKSIEKTQNLLKTESPELLCELTQPGLVKTCGGSIKTRLGGNKRGKKHCDVENVKRINSYKIFGGFVISCIPNFTENSQTHCSHHLKSRVGSDKQGFLQAAVSVCVIWTRLKWSVLDRSHLLCKRKLACVTVNTWCLFWLRWP